MEVALHLNAPVLLVGDIHRGGVGCIALRHIVAPCRTGRGTGQRHRHQRVRRISNTETIILDPDGLGSTVAKFEDLALIGVETRVGEHKQTGLIEGRVTAAHGLLDGALACEFEACCEIDMGRTVPADAVFLPCRPALSVQRRSGKPSEGVTGYISDEGWILGTYAHGLFRNTELRRMILGNAARRKSEM